MPRFNAYEPAGVIPACLLPFFDDLTIDEASYKKHLRDVAGVRGITAVTVNAQALSSFAVADWLTNLLGSPLCNSVRLGAISVTEQNEGTSAIYGFTMTFNYRGQS